MYRKNRVFVWIILGSGCRMKTNSSYFSRRLLTILASVVWMFPQGIMSLNTVIFQKAFFICITWFNSADPHCAIAVHSQDTREWTHFELWLFGVNRNSCEVWIKGAEQREFSSYCLGSICIEIPVELPILDKFIKCWSKTDLFPIRGWFFCSNRLHQNENDIWLFYLGKYRAVSGFIFGVLISGYWLSIDAMYLFESTDGKRVFFAIKTPGLYVGVFWQNFSRFSW